MNNLITSYKDDFSFCAGDHHVEAIGIEKEPFGLLDVILIAGGEGDDNALDILALQALDCVDKRPFISWQHVVGRFPKQAHLLAEPLSQRCCLVYSPPPAQL